jgi:hypothetical protein
MTDHVTNIYEALLRLHNEGGMGNFVTFIADEEKNYYVQATGEKEGDTIYTEAVSNNSLNLEFRLNDTKINLLKRIGWLEPKGGEGNFYKDWSITWDDDRKKVAEFLFRTLEEVYGLSANDELAADIALE